MCSPAGVKYPQCTTFVNNKVITHRLLGLTFKLENKTGNSVFLGPDVKTPGRAIKSATNWPGVVFASIVRCGEARSQGGYVPVGMGECQSTRQPV